MSEPDLVIRGGTVVDGTGAPARTADVAVAGGVVTEVGRVGGRGRREVDADGALVIPGFVDIHSHYDGQAVWDSRLVPSSWHGVTTVVMSNCGVGFAPVRPADRDRLVELMEGVEDIPGTALHEGITWEWESLPEYLDALGRRRFDIDCAAQVPHGAVRLYAMGDRGAAGEPATDDDIAVMADVAAEAVTAGALGFTTSRTRNHRSAKGEPTPSLRAERKELVGIAEALGAIGRGVLQVVSDFADLDDEFATVRAMAEASGRPLSISVAQSPLAPTQYEQLLARIAAANADGLVVTGQVAPRPVGLLLSRDGNLQLHPRVRWDALYEVDADFDYEPPASASMAALGGDDPEGYARARLEAGALLYVPFLNYADGNLDAVRAMLAHPNTVPGLADGGAHVGTICDGSFPTTLLTHWGRDRAEGRFPVEYLVQRQCRDTARMVGLLDRGVVAPGHRADLNVVDFDRLRVHPPELHRDLPAGGKRFLQRADGYRHTFVAGVETYRDGEPTGDDVLPGRLVRGARPAPTT